LRGDCCSGIVRVSEQEGQYVAPYEAAQLQSMSDQLAQADILSPMRNWRLDVSKASGAPQWVQWLCSKKALSRQAEQ